MWYFGAALLIGFSANARNFKMRPLVYNYTYTIEHFPQNRDTKCFFIYLCTDMLMVLY